MRRLILVINAMVWLSISAYPAELTFPATHVRKLWRDRKGQLVISDQGIEFRPEKGKKVTSLPFDEIQSLDRRSPTELVVLTYQDRGWLLGLDARYHFRLRQGKIDDQLFHNLSQKIGRPVTNRVLPETLPQGVELNVKHLHTFGGCEGKLVFTDNAIYYRSNITQDNREWVITRDLDSIWSSDPYRLDLYVYEDNRREFSRLRVYRFLLKKPLDQVFYRSFKLRLYGLQDWRRTYR